MGPTSPSTQTGGARTAADADSETESYEYDLPQGLIASHPLPARDASRLLVLRRPPAGRPEIEDRVFPDLLEHLEEGDGLVVNDSKVFPARLVGRKPTGAAAEILLLRPIESKAYRWEALVRPGSKLKPGRTVEIADGLAVEIEASREGGREVRLLTTDDPWEAIRRHGRVPLPPYIRRESTEADCERYQTVYAAHTGSVAAPTAGLHFTGQLLDRAGAKGVRVIRITLHIGPGTFRPVDAARIEGHRLEPERYELSREAADSLNGLRGSGGRLYAVGTTVVRVLEAVLGEDDRFEPAHGSTDLFIHPPFRFRAVDRLVTNFHLPRSTLLMLVSAFAGRERILRAYRHAVEQRYRFYSYGDSMVIL